MVVSRIKTIAYLLIAAFLLYAIFKSPDQAASIVRTAWSGIADGLRAIGTFFDALLNGSNK
jgi:ABC-type iron transport system FetAB permease component